MAVRLTDRDAKLLAKCAVCRWLATGQVRSLYFPEATLNAVQKRLRKLAEAGYLRSHREHPTAEAIHAVGPKGKPLLEEKGLAVLPGGEVPRQIDHMLGVNDIRIAVESSSLPVAFFFAYWELADAGWSYPAIPDAVFALRTPERRTFLVEYDRGTETLEKVMGKLNSYDKGFEGFPFEAVLVITERTRRLDVLARGLRKKGVATTVLATTLEEVKAGGIFEAALLDLLRGEKRRLLEGPILSDETDEASPFEVSSGEET
jgi:hypothetical protein